MTDRINNWSDLRRFLDADRRGDGPRVYLTRPTTRFVAALRLAEWIDATRAPRPVKTVVRMRLRHYGRSFGFTIPMGTCGPGLKLPHWGTIVVSPKARIGANATIHTSVNIGGAREAPTIGDDCYISPGAKLYGPITLGDRCRVGMNAIVNQDFPDDSTIVAPRATALGRT